MATDIFTHKIGDTFAYAGFMNLDQDGAPITSLDGITVAAAVRTYPAFEEVAALVVTLGAYTADGFPVSLECADTTAWPRGRMCFDVQVTMAGGRVISSETVIFAARPDVTR